MREQTSFLDKKHTLLNQLLLVHMYRTEAYQKASEEGRKPELAAFFTNNAALGERMINELSRQTDPRYACETEDTSIPATVQRIWTTLPDALFGASKNQILDKCLAGESFTLTLYKELQAYENLLTPTHRSTHFQQVLVQHQQLLRQGVLAASKLRDTPIRRFIIRVQQLSRYFIRKQLAFN